MDLSRYRIDFRGEVRTADFFGPGFLPQLASLVERYVPTGNSFLEWGSGMTTQVLSEIVARRGGRLVTIDTDPSYMESVLSQVGPREAVQPIVADLIGPKLISGEALNYTMLPLSLGRDFQFILIDGRRRVECALTAFVLSKPDTVVALHDYRRTRYQMVKILFDVLEDGPHFRVLRAKPGLVGATAGDRAELFEHFKR
jgi:hypothetical protein